MAISQLTQKKLLPELNLIYDFPFFGMSFIIWNKCIFAYQLISMPLIYRFVLPFLFLLPRLGSAQNVPFDPLQFPDQEEEFNIAVDEYNEGDELFSKGPAFYRQALEKYMNAHGFNPNEARLNHQIGSIYSELGQLDPFWL